MWNIDAVQEAANYIKQFTANSVPSVAIVLGSGLGNFSNEVAIKHKIPYSEIPHFPTSRVEGHGNCLIIGECAGVPVLLMSGRFHFYEGYSPQQVGFPVRVMKAIGIQILILSNAAGAVNPDYQVGDLMLIEDHISFFTPNPLIGANEKLFGPRFVDMSSPYDSNLIHKTEEIAKSIQLKLHKGVYVAVTGPTFETRAEYKFIKIMGGDVVGMSTVQECITAIHCGIRVWAISVVTDIGIKPKHEDNSVSHEEVLAAAAAAEPKLSLLIKKLIASI